MWHPVPVPSRPCRPVVVVVTRWLCVGSYSDESAPGLHLYEFSPDAAATHAASVTGLANPSFIVGRPDIGMIYAVNETDPPGGISAVRLRQGRFTLLGTVDGVGGAPCHIASVGATVLTANYSSGGVAMHALNVDGTVGDLVGHDVPTGSGPHWRQESSHLHCVVPHPDGSCCYVADLGTDRILRYNLRVEDGQGGIELDGSTSLEPGSGPRHLVFHPHDPLAAVVCELDATVRLFDVDPHSGDLSQRCTLSTLPVGEGIDVLPAAVQFHPSGRHLYVSNRGHNSIATYACGPGGESFALTAHVDCAGATPRDIAIDATGNWMVVANQDADSVDLFAIDPHSGVPFWVRQLAVVAQPTCVMFFEEDE